MVARLKDNGLSGWPRGLRMDLAAAYIRLSVSELLVLEAAGEFSAFWLTRGRKIYLQ